MSLYGLYSGLYMLTSTTFSIILSRLGRDRPSIEPVDKFTPKTIMRSASSPHVIMTFIMYFMVGMISYGLAYFLPSIVKQLGFGANKTQLLSVGPFAAGFFGGHFFNGSTYQDLCTACFSSDFNHCVLVRPV